MLHIYPFRCSVVTAVELQLTATGNLHLQAKPVVCWNRCSRIWTCQRYLEHVANPTPAELIHQHPRPYGLVHPQQRSQKLKEASSYLEQKCSDLTCGCAGWIHLLNLLCLVLQVETHALHLGGFFMIHLGETLWTRGVPRFWEVKWMMEMNANGTLPRGWQKADLVCMGLLSSGNKLHELSKNMKYWIQLFNQCCSLQVLAQHRPRYDLGGDFGWTLSCSTYAFLVCYS